MTSTSRTLRDSTWTSWICFKTLDLDVAGEFLVMATNLVYIKSRSLLPVHVQPPEEEADEEDPRWELVRQLIEYKKFKEAAAHLHGREVEREGVFPRVAASPEEHAERPLGEVSVFDLINAFNKILKRIESKREDLREIFEENYTVADKIDLILKMATPGVALRFTELFTDAASRAEGGDHFPRAARTHPAEATALRAAGGFW